jgi:uncharacterized membrane protein SirB2
MFYLRHLGFTVGVNIAAIGLFFLTTAIVFVKSSRYAEDAVVIGGSVICFMGIFAFCPMSLMWEWATMALLLVLIIAVEAFRALRKALQTAEKVGDAVLGAVTKIVAHGGEQAVHRGMPQVEHVRSRVPKGRAEWLLSLMLGLTVFIIANMIRIIVFTYLTPINIIFWATALIGLGVLGMMASAFSMSNNANEDLMAGCSVAIGWTGLFLAWPHPVWHIMVLLLIMSVMAGGTLGPIIVQRAGQPIPEQKALTAAS